MHTVVNLRVADEEFSSSEFFIIVPDCRRSGLPNKVCTYCDPKWLRVHEAGQEFCREWNHVVEAVAHGDFVRAKKLDAGLKPLSLKIESMVDELIGPT